MPALQPGTPFPDFALQDQHGVTHTRESMLGGRYVVFFYPKDDTPGCTVEACEFRDALPGFAAVPVLGVSPDSVKSHAKFAHKFQLTFPLLADTETELADACGVWVEKSMYGKTYMGVARTTFLVGADGLIARTWEQVVPKGHAAGVLAGGD